MYTSHGGYESDIRKLPTRPKKTIICIKSINIMQYFLVCHLLIADFLHYTRIQHDILSALRQTPQSHPGL